MNPIKPAIYRALTETAAGIVVALGNNQITTAWPKSGDTFPRISYLLISPSQHYDIPTREHTYQIDIWSTSEDLNDRLAELVMARLDKRPLPVDPQRARVLEAYCTEGPDLFELDTGLHHKVMNYQVTWNPVT